MGQSERATPAPEATEFDLPLRVKRLRCANPDTVEWRLQFGDTPMSIIWVSAAMPWDQAVAQLFERVGKGERW